MKLWLVFLILIPFVLALAAQQHEISRLQIELFQARSEAAKSARIAADQALKFGKGVNADMNKLNNLAPDYTKPLHWPEDKP